MSKLGKTLGLVATVVAAFCVLFTVSYLITQKADTAIQDGPKTVQIAEPHAYTVDELLAEANKLRAERGVAPLVLDERLNQSAQWKANDMANSGIYEHSRDGYHGYQKARELVPECGRTEENLNIGSVGHNPFGKETGWPSSEPHYEAITSPANDTTGFGITTDGATVIYVQHFCDMN